ncbi:hypothetical protein BC827DRAFT_1155931 [Russula dissimulans]|nr:hypothetical protein BC827DRAFT_1155931 [Russula dissimulans]
MANLRHRGPRGNVGTCLNLGRFMTPFANSERPKRLLRRPNASIKLRQGVAQWEYRCGASATEGGDELAPLSKSKNLMVMKSRSHVADSNLRLSESLSAPCRESVLVLEESARPPNSSGSRGDPSVLPLNRESQSDPIRGNRHRSL